MKVIKKMWWAAAVTFLLAVCSLFLPTYTAKAENNIDVTDSVTASGWVTQNELKVTYLSLGENVIPGIGYGIIDNDAYTYAQDYIAINGKTIREINSDTTLGASGWTYTVFPSNLDAKYKLPIIVYVNNGQLEIKIHGNYVETLGDVVEITAKAGLYFENGGTRYEVTQDKSFVVLGQKLNEAELAEGVTIEGWNQTGSAMELTYTIIRFPEGVLPSDIGYHVHDNDIGTQYHYIKDYITVNGKTVGDINTETDTSGYVFSSFPSTAADKYKLPIILEENEDKISVKFHNTYLETLDGDITITLKAGFYFVNGDTKYTLANDVSLLVESVKDVDITEDITIEGWNVTGNSQELTYTMIRFPEGVLSSELNYHVIDTSTWAYVQEYITINGKTVKEINEDTDTSNYVFSTFPSTNGAPFNVPVIIFENGNKFEVKIHNTYLETLDGDITITLKAGLNILNGMQNSITSADVSFVQKAIVEVDIADDISIEGWWAAGDKMELTYTTVRFPADVLYSEMNYDAMDKAAWRYLQEYIYFNGKSIKQINEETDVSNYEFSTFPSTAADKYKVPVIIFENNNALEIKFHNAYLQNAGYTYEVTVKAGLEILVGNTRYVVGKDVTQTLLQVTETDISGNFAINGWASTGDKMELTHTRIQFPAGVLPETLDYHAMDEAAWIYLQDYILLNGKSIRQINEETDVSGYEFSTFPSTEAAIYKVPIILFESGNSLELKIHNTYLQTVEGDLEITLKEGLYILAGAVKYVASKDVYFQLVGDIWADKNRTYTVTYYLNGEVYGTVEEYAFKTPFTLRADVTAAPGSTFSGWEYTPTSVIVQDMKIYGYIQPIRYTVTYHMNGGVNHSNNPIVYYAADGEILLQDATKEGAIFKGWYTSEDYTQKVEKLSPEQLGNIELYALFEGEEKKGNGWIIAVVAGAVVVVGGLTFAGVAIVLKKKKIMNKEKDDEI